MSAARLLAGPALVALIAVGCGSGSDEPRPEPRPPETAERVGDLPPGWETVSNDAQGFEIGVPPGWGEGRACGAKTGAESAGPTQLCSPDRLVTLRVAVDRTDQALELSPEESATRTADALSEQSFDGKLKAGKPKPVKGHYDGASVTGEGRAGKVQQTLDVYALQRKGIAVISAVIAANADENAEAGVDLAVEAVESVRTKPVG